MKFKVKTFCKINFAIVIEINPDINNIIDI